MIVSKMKELDWIGSSKKDLLDFPIGIRKEMGHALYMAQSGGKHRYSKPLKGFGGAKILEIALDDGNGTYRTMYTVEFEEVIYVLHAFQKKSKTGIKTPKADIDLVEQRLKELEQKYQEWTKSQLRVRKMAKKKQRSIEEIECEASSGNVFADLGIENPEEELTKAKLVWEIEQIIKKRKLTQVAAAKAMGINQPKVSALIRRKLDGFSVERLIHFLNALGQDIDIIVRQKPRSRKQAIISVYHDSDSCHLAVPIAAKSR